MGREPNTTTLMPLDRGLGSQFAFGPFRFIPFERMLLHADQPLHLGSRAKEILLVLIEHAGEVVEKQTLIARVWPDTVVEEGALRVHIAALRRTLGDGNTGIAYVENVHGQGYRFVAPITRIDNSHSMVAPANVRPVARDDLPIPLTRMIGRNEVLATLTSRLPKRRFMTIVGPAGIGKTTVAVATADALRASYHNGVRHIELASLSDPALIGELIASRLGIQAGSSDPLHNIAAHLCDKSLLMVMDNCEHVVQAVAYLVESLLSVAPNLHILATSREPLRAHSEWVLRLEPLARPGASAELSAREALQFPAIQLFAERAQANVGNFELQDCEVPILTEICRRLDGLPLAIELAAAHVDRFGVRGLLARISTEDDLGARKQEAVVQRHHTLSTALDWSYGLLSNSERLVLHRLSVFVGAFALEAAQSVTAGYPTDRAQTFADIASLISKSLVAAEVGREEMRYRLLETTRAYALRKLIQSGARDEVARRHANYYCQLLERREHGHASFTDTAEAAEYAEQMSNVRAALEWSFSSGGDRNIGIAVAAAAAPSMLGLSLLNECRAWMERAIAALDSNTRGTHREMEIQAALALSLMFTRGNSDESLAALTRALDLAAQFKDPRHMLRLFGALHIFLVRTGDFRGALDLARQAEVAARTFPAPAAHMIADSMLGISHHLLGNQDRALTHCQAALNQSPLNRYDVLGRVGYDHRLRTLVALTRTLWLRGYAEQAVEIAGQTLKEAEQLGHPVSLGFSFIYVASVLLWVGRWSVASEVIERLLSHADRHGLAPYHTVGLGLRAELTLRKGDVSSAIALQRACLKTLDADRHRILAAVFVTNLAEGLAMSGQAAEALATVDAALATGAEDESGTDDRHSFQTPELLRIRARILALQSHEESPKVEECLMRAIAIARGQAALAWELRAATDLAQLWRRSHREEAARELLAGVYGRFNEGFETPDLVAARRLLLELE